MIENQTNTHTHTHVDDNLFVAFEICFPIQSGEKKNKLRDQTMTNHHQRYGIKIKRFLILFF